jgi:hypothetical protein
MEAVGRSDVKRSLRPTRLTPLESVSDEATLAITGVEGTCSYIGNPRNVCFVGTGFQCCGQHSDKAMVVGLSYKYHAADIHLKKKIKLV